MKFESMIIAAFADVVAGKFSSTGHTIDRLGEATETPAKSGFFFHHALPLIHRTLAHCRHRTLPSPVMIS
jgi:hypothetical protein